MKMIRWVGHPSPLYDPKIGALIAQGKLPAPVVLAFQAFEHNRRISIIRGSVFHVGPEHGFTQHYTWRWNDLDVQMADVDWARLAKRSIDRAMFQDITNGVHERPSPSINEWREIIDDMQKYPAPQALVAM